MFTPPLKRLGLLASLAAVLSGCATIADEPANSLSLGEMLYRLIVGGIAIGESTLLRFYVWHIAGLIVPMIFLVGWHVFRVRRDGGISHRETAAGTLRIDREQLVRTETLAFFLTLATLIVLATLVDAPIGNPPDRGLAADPIEAPWVFWWVQELLRIWPPAIAGVLIPLLFTGLLAALPFIDRSDQGIAIWFNRPGRMVQLIFILILMCIAGLTIRTALR